jgi:ribosome maturation factor RimP
MAKPVPQALRGVARELDSRVEALGYEAIEVEWAGSSARPLIRVRIDRIGAVGDEGVSVDDCARVSRALEAWLEQVETMPERYVLEVSSPGVDRPLLKPRDFDRFAGKKVALKGSAPLAGRATRLEGELLGLVRGGEEGEERVRLRLPGGDEVEIPRAEISGAHLVFEW